MQRIPSIALALVTAAGAMSFAGAAEAKDRGGHHWHGHGHHWHGGGHHYGWGGVGVNLIDPGYDDSYYSSYDDDDDFYD